MKNNTTKRIYRSKSQWKALIRKYESSGLSQKEFCKRNGIAPGTFAKGYARHRHAVEVPRFPDDYTKNFIPVEVIPSDEAASSHTQNIDNTIDISIGAATIHISAGFDPDLLKSLASVLAEVC